VKKILLITTIYMFVYVKVFKFRIFIYCERMMAVHIFYINIKTRDVT